MDSDPCHHLPYLQPLPHLTSGSHCRVMPKEQRARHSRRAGVWGGVDAHTSSGKWYRINILGPEERGSILLHLQEKHLPVRTPRMYCCYTNPFHLLLAGISMVRSQTTKPHRITAERLPRSQREVPAALPSQHHYTPPSLFYFHPSFHRNHTETPPPTPSKPRHREPHSIGCGSNLNWSVEPPTRRK